MKTATLGFINFLASGTEFLMTELYTITLVDGEVLRYTTWGNNLSITISPEAGNTFLTGPPNFVRGQVTEELTLSKIGELDVTIQSNPTDLINGTPFLQRVVRGDFDKASIKVERLFMDTSLVQQGI